MALIDQGFKTTHQTNEQQDIMLQQKQMNINYGMEIVRATEIAALTAARHQGLGVRYDVLNRARSAIFKTLDRLNIKGVIKNDRFANRDGIVQIPQSVGTGGPQMDLMAVAIEGHYSTAEGRNNSTSYAVIAEEGSILSVPNLNMYKMVVGKNIGDVIDVNKPPAINIKRVARTLGKYTENVTVCVLNRTEHQMLINEIRSCGARIKLLEEGEISGALAAIIGEKADIYIGYGYAPEGVLMAAAISCLGGYFVGKIYCDTKEEHKEASKFGINDFDRIYTIQDLVFSKNVSIAATGITDGEFLEGVRFTPDGAITSSFVARAETLTYRKIETTHFFDYKPVF